MDIIRCAETIGYLQGNEPGSYKNNLIELLRMVTEPLRVTQSYDFAQSDLAIRMQHIFLQMRLNSNYGAFPPFEVLFLHRKLAGVYLLLTQLRANISIRDLSLVKKLIY